MSKILIVLLIFSFSTSAQFLDKNLSLSKKDINSEIFTLNSDSIFIVFYLYKIPYSRLVFEKNNSNFISKFEINLEVKNSKQQIVQRKFKKETIELNNYDATVSDNIFHYDFIEFVLEPDSFICHVALNDLVANRSFNIFNRKLDLLNTNDKLNWLLIKNHIQNENSFEVEVLGNVIPYSSENYAIMISLRNDFPELNRVFIKLKDSSVTNLDYVRIKSFSPKIYSYQRNLKILLDPDMLQDILLVKNINEKLFEGKYVLQINQDENKLAEIPISVSWIDKPLSLKDYDFALELIELIEVDANFRTYFSSESEKKKKLYNYWRIKDPTPNSSFNELMNEFYLRADFAQREFISISQKNGAKTDRGKIYILNGKPNKIERSVNVDGKVVEIWYYKNPDRTYSFIDFKGDGTFKLTK